MHVKGDIHLLAQGLGQQTGANAGSEAAWATARPFYQRQGDKVIAQQQAGP